MTKTAVAGMPEDREVPAPAGKQLPATQQDAKAIEQLLQARGISKQEFQVLRDVIHPNAKSDISVLMAFDYCRARRLDPFKKHVHIVPMYSKKKGDYVDTVWPGIGEQRITAMRTGEYAGCDAAEFGPDVMKTFQCTCKKNHGDKTLTFPEWCQLTVYRFVQGQKVAFPGPKVRWLEEYATVAHDCEVPNDMWAERAYGQSEKCGEAAALRRAFPEECSEPTAEEMHGKVLSDGEPPTAQQQVQKVAQQKAVERAAAAGDIVDAEVKPTAADELAAVQEVVEDETVTEAAEEAAAELQKKVKIGDLIMAATRNGWKLPAAKAWLEKKCGVPFAQLQANMTYTQFVEAQKFFETTTQSKHELAAEEAESQPSSEQSEETSND